MSQQTALYFDEYCLWHTTGEYVSVLPVGNWIQPQAGNGHPESPESKRRIKSLMDVSGLTAQLAVHTAEPATMDDLLRVHTDDYLQKLKGMSDAGGGLAGFDAPFGQGSYEIACLSAGLAKQAVDDVFTRKYKNAFSLGRPPGHHCLPDSGMGFCLLANIAIAIEAAKHTHGIEKVAVVDWDVHHGNGTQTIFYDRADVLTISLHQENNFPPRSGPASERGTGEGEGYNLNIPLLPGSGHEVYLYAMQRLVLPTLHAYNPDLIIVASGLDANGFDPLGRMQLHSGSYREMTRLMMNAANELCGGRLVVVHEGGYSESYVPFCGLAIVEELSGHRTAVEDPFLGLTRRKANERFVAFHCGLIDEMASALQ
ncbi:MAG: class II histone deacetylase [Chloroflexota bacterium]